MSEINADFVGTISFECPKCKCDVFEEVQTDVTVSTKFKRVEFDGPGDLLEPDYGEAENHGGVIDRYQCAACGHIVAKTTTEFTTWLQEHGKK